MKLHIVRNSYDSDHNSIPSNADHSLSFSELSGKPEEDNVKTSNGPTDTDVNLDRCDSSDSSEEEDRSDNSYDSDHNSIPSNADHSLSFSELSGKPEEDDVETSNGPTDTDVNLDRCDTSDSSEEEEDRSDNSYDSDLNSIPSNRGVTSN